MSHPVSLTLAQDEGQNRLWGIPFFGSLVRWFLVIPHLIIVLLLGLAMYVVLLVHWIPILVNGRQAGWIIAVIEAYLRVAARATLYTALITGRYPPIAVAGEHSLMLSITPERVNRLWGIPFLGIWARWLILIPHFLIVAVLGIGIGLLVLVSWIPVLVNGRQASSIVSYFAGFYRWSARITAYGLFITNTYPPFSFDE